MISHDNNNFKDGDSKKTSGYIKGAPSVYNWGISQIFLGYAMTDSTLKHVIINPYNATVDSYHNYSERNSFHAPAYISEGYNNFIWADTNGALKILNVIN